MRKQRSELEILALNKLKKRDVINIIHNKKRHQIKIITNWKNFQSISFRFFNTRILWINFYHKEEHIWHYNNQAFNLWIKEKSLWI